ncbi:hypothetical protein SLE2022_140850 [Rubroshorea leprosula]
MKVISWNSRGVLYRPFKRKVKELLRSHKPDIICFMETKVEFGSGALYFMRRYGYSLQFQVPASGFAGGLWLFWKGTVQLSVIFSTNQAVQCLVLFRGSSLFLTFGYVRLQESFKDDFWTHLQDWKASHSGAWVLMGDLNDVASMDEVSPRSAATFNQTQRFQNHLEDCGLMNMETLGCKYTWCRMRNGRPVLCERLDRILLNSDSQLLLQGAKAFNLPRTCSDHYPILLNMYTAASYPLVNKPTRFEAAWLSRDEFSRVFTDAWSQHSNDLASTINKTGKACISWSKTAFGDIFRQKRLLKACIACIQNSSCYLSSSGLQNLEQSLLEDYQKVLYEEELLWFQKSRVDWIASSNRNTSFYHMATMVRRNRNSIEALKIDGEWCMEANELKSHVRSYFEGLFDRGETSPLFENLLDFQASIYVVDQLSLIQPATIDEVWKALFSMKRLKRPGPDGIPALFYNRHWNTVAATFLEFVNQALLTGSFDPCLTKAFVALIPKRIHWTLCKNSANQPFECGI